MNNDPQPEVWMRGSIAGVPPLLQPVAHALLQVKEEVNRYLLGFDDRLLWEKPGGMASVGFHLQHMAGVTERLFTYAADKALSVEQLNGLRTEGAPDPLLSSAVLVTALGSRVDTAIQQLRQTDEATLTDIRYLGRKRIPTTQLGLLFHAAEHTQRHLGQLLVTVRLLPLLSR
ncbi:DinB family protein [Parapedobacter lycopersici]|uniref:DinB family protein n=1 Tax=Parapedobacter lycopersici TaxID=1864939 RepID=UPI0033422F65